MIGSSKGVVGWLCFALVLCFSSVAAAITQPTTGTTIPIIYGTGTTCSDKNVQLCLNDAEGNTTNINALTDALVAPETFQPTCKLTFTPLVKGGTIIDAFGWYNVKPDPLNPGEFIRPAVAQMYGMFASGQYPAGDVRNFQTGVQLAGKSFVLDLNVEKAAGRYTGGAIGFFVVSGEGAITIDMTTHQLLGAGGAALVPQFMFFTQHALNTVNQGSKPGAIYYNVLTWQSVKDPNTFYFGWEDLPIPSGSDSDFDDMMFAVTGVKCGGGGEACDTGKLGPCKAGTLQCRKGALTCVQTVPEGPETCNAVDDDCNGQVDDGMLCGADQICSHGACVSNCAKGEFPCAPGTACNARGECVDPACAAVDCPEGQACRGGKCVDACTGIVCPNGRVCLNGGCVDPCLGVQCDPGFTCVLGVCSSCACSECATGQVCSKNLCVESGCETQSCGAGSHCQGGQCVDNCAGATCPAGQTCSNGDCVVSISTGGRGGSGGGSGGDGTLSFGADTSFGNNGGAMSGGGSSSGGSSGRLSPAAASKAGCGCKVPGQSPRGSGAAVLLALLGLAWRRRSNHGRARTLRA
jgi:MYXO-CTERM domain-containing protein